MTRAAGFRMWPWGQACCVDQPTRSRRVGNANGSLMKRSGRLAGSALLFRNGRSMGLLWSLAAETGMRRRWCAPRRVTPDLWSRFASRAFWLRGQGAPDPQGRSSMYDALVVIGLRLSVRRPSRFPWATGILR